MRPRVSLPGPKGRQQSHTLPEQFLPKTRRPVVVIAYQYPLSTFSELRDNAQFMEIGGSHSETCDHPRPAQTHVNPKSIEGLPGQDILTEGSFSREPPTSVSPSELTDGGGGKLSTRAKAGS